MVVSYLAVMNVPVLYDILGKRIDMVLDGLRGESGGYSMDERTLMIGYGIEFMSGHLWLGNGLMLSANCLEISQVGIPTHITILLNCLSIQV